MDIPTIPTLFLYVSYQLLVNTVLIFIAASPTQRLVTRGQLLLSSPRSLKMTEAVTTSLNWRSSLAKQPRMFLKRTPWTTS